MNTAIYDDFGQREPSRITNKAPDNSEGGRNKENNMNNEMTMITCEVGKIHPAIKSGETQLEGNTLEMNEDGTLSLFCKMPIPHQEEIDAFAKLRAVGLYLEPGLEQGLWLWQFDKNMILETPFNPKDYSDRRVELMGDNNTMMRYLIDDKGVIRAMVPYGLFFDFLKTAKAIWTNPQIEWGGYSDHLKWLYSNYSTKELWNRVVKILTSKN